jgi:CheY-like chemotaxis protein
MKDISLLYGNGIDVQKSLELLGDMETYDATLEDFLAGIYGKLADLKSYKEISDMANYAIYAHSIKSDARYLGFTRLADLAYQHEMESKSNNIYFVTNNYDALIKEADRIINVVKQYLGKEYVASSVAERPKIVKDKKILVVDDSNLIRNFVEKIFADSYEVVMATDGQVALDVINTNGEDIAAVLLDLNMPNVNGFDVLEYFKQNNLFKKIPVSIISGAEEKETIDKAFTYEIVDLLSKPFNERDIKSVIEKTINYKNM